MIKKAFLYNDRFFLFPDGSCDGEMLRKSCDSDGNVTLTELVEKRCMVPYFVDKYMVESTVKLTEEFGIYPFDAEVMTMKEYNRRLREVVTNICPGCESFTELTPSDSSLRGHHEEATLNGVCFVRDEAGSEEGYTFSPLDMGIEEFTKTFGKLKLEKLIDSGKAEEASEKLWESLSDELFPPDNPLILDHPDGGKYRLVYSSLFNHTDAILWEAVFDSLDKKYGEAWEFYNYIPKGMFPNGAKRPLGIVLEESYAPSRKDIKVYTDGDSASLYYIWLCGLVGEERLNAVVAEFDFIAVDGELPENVMTVEEFADEVADHTAEYEKDDLIIPYPESIPFVPEECDEDSPEEEIDAKVRMYSVRSRELFFGLLMTPYETEERNNVWNEESNTFFSLTERPVAKLVFRDPPINGLREYNTEKMAEFNVKTIEFVKNLKTKNLIKLFNQCISAEVIEVAAIVMNLTKLKYEVRRLSPILGDIEAELVVYTNGGVADGRYKIGFDMEKIEE